MSGSSQKFFHRPVDFDAEAVRKSVQASAVKTGNFASRLKNEFGLSDDEDTNDTEPTLPRETSGGGESVGKVLEAQYQIEIADLKRQIEALNEANVSEREKKALAEQAAREAAETVKQMQITVRGAKTLMAKEYNDLIDKLKDEIESQKQQLEEDNQIIESLHQRIDEVEKHNQLLQNGGQTVDVMLYQAAVREAEQAKGRVAQIEKDLAAARSQTKELAEEQLAVQNKLAEADATISLQQETIAKLEANEHQHQQLQEQKQQPQQQKEVTSSQPLDGPKTTANAPAEPSTTGDGFSGTEPPARVDPALSRDNSTEVAMTTTTPLQPNADTAAITLRLEKLEAERKLFKIELKKRLDERNLLLSKIQQLAEVIKKKDGELRAIQDKIGDRNGVAGSDPAALSQQLQSVLDSLETANDQNKRLLLRISELESAQSNTAVTTMDEVVQLRSLVQEKDAALAGSVEETNKLKEVARKLDEIVTKKDEEMNLLRDKARKKLAVASGQMDKLREEWNKQMSKNKEQKQDMDKLTATVDALQSAKRAHSAQFVNALRTTHDGCGALKSSVQDLRNVVSCFGQMWDAYVPELVSAVQRSREQQELVTEHIMDRYRTEMKERKRLFNLVQELKGNIRVYCRVRPLSASEQKKGCGDVVTYPEEGALTVYNPAKETDHHFEFDKVFAPDVSQEGVFAQVSDLITSVLDGYNVCIFAYGQTGSGKTHTMQGPAHDRGVNYRALQQLFAVQAQRRDTFEYKFTISLLEIYNEDIQDLLSNAQAETLKIVRGADGMVVNGLTTETVSSLEEVLQAMHMGSQNRSVGKTDMNEHSSRSHLVFTIVVEGRNLVTNTRTVAKLNLIDLAGSERVGRSNATGQRLKEAQSINSSLSALGLCISARANNAAHVPYRNSTLTYLLQDSLEKNSKTLIMVQVSPADVDAGETFTSLKFAEHARLVELGPVKKGTVAVTAKKSAPTFANARPSTSGRSN